MEKVDDIQVAVLQQIANTMRELLLWARVMGYPAVKRILESVLDTDEKSLVYQLTGINMRNISEWGQEWERIGIAEPSRVSVIKGRRQRVFDLKDFGFQIPDID